MRIVVASGNKNKLREIAEITDAKMSTVKSRFRQGMEKLKAYMEKESGERREQDR